MKEITCCTCTYRLPTIYLFVHDFFLIFLRNDPVSVVQYCTENMKNPIRRIKTENTGIQKFNHKVEGDAIIILQREGLACSLATKAVVTCAMK
jgi:hypothetical protein